MVMVYSRNARSVRFDIEGKAYVVNGLNSVELTESIIKVGGATAPVATELPDDIFAKIQDKYKAHTRLFGGTLPNGAKTDGLIFAAKSKSEAKAIADDQAPILPDAMVITKSKTVKKLEADE